MATPQPSSYTNKVIANLDVFKQAGKLVLVIDYVTQQNLIDDFYSKAKAKGYVPYATVRSLDRVTINPGHEPD
jgi:Predicted extracellular endo alpha-1,4 polygalactosaminidase or related polysaccharide hydrolase